jgi:hypothetical protein
MQSYSSSWTSATLKIMQNSNRFSALEAFYNGNQIISGEKFLKYSQLTCAFNYLKRDFLYRSGVWRDGEVKSLFRSIPKFKSKTLVLGHSDLPTKTFDSLLLARLGIPQIFALNANQLGTKLNSLPLGITNDCDDSPIHRILGNEKHFIKANTADFSDNSFDGTIYLNFTSQNNSAVRKKVLAVANEISTLYKVTVQYPEFTDRGRIRYLECLRSHGLVLCPEGNGVDTHRFWETVYMGGIPVVTRNRKMQRFYDHLPVMQLDSWEELSDRSLIESRWWNLKDTRFKFDLLSMDFWIEKFSTD